METRKLKNILLGTFAIALLTFQGQGLMAQNKGNKPQKETKEVRKSEQLESTIDNQQAEKVKKDQKSEKATNGNKEKNKAEGQKEVGEDKKDLSQKGIKENTGNAYGKNKGELSGKEYGQERATQAKVNKEKGEKLDQYVSQGEQKVKDAKTKIKSSKAKLDKDKKAGRVSDSEYRARKEKIDRAEAAVNDLDQKVQKGKKLDK